MIKVRQGGWQPTGRQSRQYRFGKVMGITLYNFLLIAVGEIINMEKKLEGKYRIRNEIDININKEINGT